MSDDGNAISDSLDAQVESALTILELLPVWTALGPKKKGLLADAMRYMADSINPQQQSHAYPRLDAERLAHYQRLAQERGQ